MSELTKEYVKKLFDEQNKHIDGRIDKMAAMIKHGFDNTSTSQNFEVLNQKNDKVYDRLQTVETKLDRALYTDNVHLERRIKRLEEHVGIKPAHA